MMMIDNKTSQFEVAIHKDAFRMYFTFVLLHIHTDHPHVCNLVGVFFSVNATWNLSNIES